MKLMVGIPAYNTEKYIGSVISIVKMYVDNVIVVDDGSNDETSLVAELSGAEVIRLDENEGKGRCVKRLMRIAKHRKSNLILMDSDFQHVPHDLDLFKEKLKEGYDLVIGKRESKDIPFLRRIGNKFLSFITTREDIDTQSGFRALSLRALEKLDLKQSGFAIESEMVKVSQEKKLKITEVPIHVKYHKNGHALSPFEHGFEVFSEIFRFIVKREPLRVFGVASILCFVIAFFSGVRVIRSFEVYGEFAFGSAFFMLLFAIYAGLLLMLGVILNIFKKEGERK